MSEQHFDINGVGYTVEIVQLGANEATVRVNGADYQVAFDSGLAPAAHASRAQSAAPAAIAAAAPSATATQSEIKAPMSGVVLSVAVKPGDQVTAGQQLLALEAMKMENPIKTGRAATVKTVHVAVGASVNQGDPLVTLA